MRVYKITTPDGMSGLFPTHIPTQWGENVTHQLEKAIKSPSPADAHGWFWSFKDPLFAAAYAPEQHHRLENTAAILWEAEAEGDIVFYTHNKIASRILTTIRVIPMPVVDLVGLYRYLSGKKESPVDPEDITAYKIAHMLMCADAVENINSYRETKDIFADYRKVVG